jgi:hypothetical protein
MSLTLLDSKPLINNNDNNNNEIRPKIIIFPDQYVILQSGLLAIYK